MNNLRGYISGILRTKLNLDVEDRLIDITPLTEGGSERNFYRVVLSDGKTFVYMKYSGQKEENKYWYDVAILFKKLNINIPEIYFNEDGSIFIEDLGNVHLYNLVKSSDEKDILKYYYAVLDQLLNLHLVGKGRYEEKPFKISNSFNYSLYRWESSYFIDNLIKDYFNVQIKDALTRKIEADFNFLADKLSAERIFLIHRDCQSKNIMIKNNRPYFIDFQGLRFGVPQYDLASLFEDPYVDLTNNTKEELLNYYIKKALIPDKEQFFRVYRYCAIQRLMQALGAYAFLGEKKGKKDFLQYIPNGLKRLKDALDIGNDLSGIKELLNHLSAP